MKRVLITGASGFVGSNLARYLVKEGHQVNAFVRPESDLWRLNDIIDAINLHPVSLANKEAVQKATRAIKPEWVFHLAVHGAYSWQEDLARMIEANVSGTGNLLEACLEADFESFVNTGSSSEYGFKDHAPAEDELPEPNSYYAVTKVSATMLCQYIAKKHKVNVSTLRLYSVFGAYEEPARLLPTLIIKGMEGQLPILVDPKIARDYIYIDDVISAYIQAARIPTDERGAIYNVGTSVQTSIAEIVEVARKLLPINVEPEWGSMLNRTWDSNCWVANNTKIKSKLHWQPKYDLASGFEHMVDWFKSNPKVLAYYRSKLAEQVRA